MKIGIGKIGKAFAFDSNKWGAVGGDNEAPILFEHLIRNNPQHQFILICSSDYDRLPQYRKDEINKHGNLIDAWAGYTEWRKTDWVKKHPAGDRQDFMENVILKNPDYKVDTAIIMMGISATSNVWGHAKLNDCNQLAKPLDMQKRYSGPPIHYLNTYRDIKWVMLLNDPRLYPGKMRDLWNPPVKVISQYNQQVVHRNYVNHTLGDSSIEEHNISCTYDALETIFLIGKKRGEMLEQAPSSLESFFDDSPEEGEKDIDFMIVCNEGKPSRYPTLKKYILDHVQDVDIYGQWDERVIGDDPRFKGPKKFNDLQQMLPRVKYTFCIPIKKGWCTAKFWEMAHYGIIPFLHPTYDAQDNIKAPDFIRVKDSKDLFDKIKFLEEKPKAYKELRDLLDNMLKDEYYDGSYLNNKIMEQLKTYAQ